MKFKKMEMYLWILISVVIAVIFVLHPRIPFVAMLLFSFCQFFFARKTAKMATDESFSETKASKSDRGFKHFFFSLIALLMIWYFTSFFTIFVPYHAPYEYKSEIKQFKRKNGNYDHFPDVIPHGARKVKWVNMPSLLQGSGYEGLFFYADDSYLDEEFLKYKDQSKVYHAVPGSSSVGFEVDFPMRSYAPDDTKKDMVVLVLYDNEDWNHHHINGLYLNRKEGYICYFTE